MNAIFPTLFLKYIWTKCRGKGVLFVWFFTPNVIFFPAQTT